MNELVSFTNCTFVGKPPAPYTNWYQYLIDVANHGHFNNLIIGSKEYYEII